MSSILTNDGAMIALQTLRTINSELSDVRAEIATGKKVSGAQGNSAVWAISRSMEADVAGFKRVSDNLTLGQSTVSVARQASETVTDLLTDIKGKIVSAQESNVDREKIQNNIVALREQIDGVVAAAQFNGQNLVQNTDSTAGSGAISVLASLDRSGSEVTSSDISVRRRDLGTAADAIASLGGTFDQAAATGTLNATQSVDIDTSSLTVEAGTAFTISLYGTDADDSSFEQAALRTSSGANESRAEMVANEMSYVARDGDTMTDVLSALTKKYDSYAAEQGITTDQLSLSSSGSTLTATSAVTDATDRITVNINTLSADANNTIGGGLDVLQEIDVTTNEGAGKALAQIEGLLTTAIDTASAFGSDQRRLETQNDFIVSISDEVKAGIGKLVDADLQESSARLQALQVQQQLAVQALSIANQAPSALLGLFR